MSPVATGLKPNKTRSQHPSGSKSNFLQHELRSCLPPRVCTDFRVNTSTFRTSVFYLVSELAGEEQADDEEKVRSPRLLLIEVELVQQAVALTC